MANIGQFLQSYQNFQSTFKETSFDSSNHKYLCTDESQTVINFDKIIEKNYPNSNTRPKSFDAIYLYENKIFCIEFKNQKPSQIINQDIYEKLTEGKAELDKLLQDLNIQSNNYDFAYCVAYKKCIEPRDRYKCGIDKGKVLFGSEQYKDQGLVKEIFTENVDFFTKQFKKQFQKELMC
ncbi:MAG: hypothetical protein KAI79_14855 [Bacteroidales bacterium]|nr:hypothetical protein [Bacteroidales bacterium]